MAEVTKYVILFQGRAGSTFLTEHMSSHPQIRAKHEEFASRPIEWDAQLDWMTNFYYQKPGSHHVKAVGFKTKYTDISDLDLFANFVQDNNIKVIHLFRRNLVKLIVSVIRADELRRRNGGSNLYEGQNELGKINIDPHVFRKHKKRVRIYRELKQYVDGLNVDVCRMHYEQLLNNFERSMTRICRFLDVVNYPTTADVIKNTPDRLVDAVENLDELRATFPEYERFFSEEYDSSSSAAT